MSTFIIDLTLESENGPRVPYNGEVIDLTHDSDIEVEVDVEDEVIRWNRRKRCSDDSEVEVEVEVEVKHFGRKRYLDKNRPRKFIRYNEDDEEDIEDGSFSVASTEISEHQSDIDFLDDGEESVQSSDDSFHLENIEEDNEDMDSSSSESYVDDEMDLDIHSINPTLEEFEDMQWLIDVRNGGVY